MLRRALFAIIVAAVLYLGAAGEINAQNASISHIFPQIADGRQTDNSYYESLFNVMNLNNSATSCTISLFGMSTNRLASSSTIVVPAAGWSATYTLGQQVLATGYAKLTCSQPVVASLTYFLISPNNTVIGMATVFSAPGVTYALLPLLLGGGFRHGMALANDGATSITVTLTFTSSSGQITGKTLQIPAKSQYVGFVDEIVNLPSQGFGSLELLSSQPFSITGLLFNGAAFATLVPATVQ